MDFFPTHKTHGVILCDFTTVSYWPNSLCQLADSGRKLVCSKYGLMEKSTLNMGEMIFLLL